MRSLKFAQLHKSVWICPYNFLGDVEKIVNQYDLSSFVLLAVSDRLGREPSSELVERLWGLREINDDYREYIQKVESKKLSRREAIFKFLTILNRDPQFPQDLLPDDWQGEEAHKIYRKLSFLKKLDLVS